MRPRHLLLHQLRRYLSTVNDSEVAHFSRLSSQWWDETGEFRPLHHMNPLRMKFIRDKIVQTAQMESDTDTDIEEHLPLRGMAVLDVGCGGGLLTEPLARLGGRTRGIDASASNIQVASLHAARDPRFTSENLTYEHTTAEDLLKSHEGQFDVVCSMEVVEHVDRPADFIRSLSRLTKPGGHLFLSTIARTPLSYLLTILIAERALRLVTPGTHSHDKFINPSEFLDFFKNDLKWISHLYDGLPTRSEAEIRGMAYLPWKSEWVFIPRESPDALVCNYIFWARKPLAALS